MKSDFIIALTQLAAERNLPREIVLSAIEAALVSAYRRDSVATGQDISVSLDPNTGDVAVYTVKTVAEEVVDPLLEISVEEAQKISPGAEVGQVVHTGTLAHSAGRIAAQTAKQVVVQRLREAERELVFKEFAEKEGEVFTVTVQRVEPKQIIVELGRAEAVLPVSEQAPFERYRVGARIKVLLQSVSQSNKGPEIIVSRADKELVRRLFEMEVPEIYSGAVEIVGISREAGSRSKVAVFAKQDGVDAVGSCVGLRGIRIQTIVNELHGEKVDVVQWSKDPATFITNSLSPSTVMRVEINPEQRSAIAVVPERQLSLAIGKEGQNARLAARLTGWGVNIKSNVEADAEAETPAAVEEAAAVAVASEQAVVDAEGPAAGPVEIAAEPVQEAAEDAPVVEIAATVPEAEPAVVAEEGPEQKVEAEPEPALVGVPEELLVPALIGEAATVPVGPVEDASTAISDLSEDVWSLRRRGPSTGSGVIRFAEDIEEFRGVGPRRRRRGGSRGTGRKNPRAGKKR